MNRGIATDELSELTGKLDELRSAWERLKAARDKFAACLRADAKLPAWVYPDEGESPRSREIAIKVFTEFFYADDQQPTESIKGPGLVGASPATLEAAVRLNAAKRAMIAVIDGLRGQKTLVRNPETQKFFQRDLLAVTFEKIGLARLHYRQTERRVRVPMFDDRVVRPISIGFSWDTSHNVVRITRQEAEKRLRKLGDGPHINRQIAKLRELSTDEPLAIVTNEPPQAIANLSFEVRGADGSKTIERRKVKTNIPLLVPCKPGEGLPEYSRLRDPVRETGRRRRSDRKVADEPFLEAISVHRYL